MFNYIPPHTLLSIILQAFIGVSQSPAAHSRQLRWSSITQGFPEDETREIVRSTRNGPVSLIRRRYKEWVALAMERRPQARRVMSVQQKQTLQTVAPLQSLLSNKQGEKAIKDTALGEQEKHEVPCD